MSVKDLIKKSVLELDMFKISFTPEKILQMVIALGVALLMGLVICFIYNRFFRGVVYNRSFAVTLVGMTVLTCMVTLAISTNVVLSLANSNISASHDYYYNLVQANTALLLAVLPLLILYVLFQRQIIAGIERSGLVE